MITVSDLRRQGIVDGESGDSKIHRGALVKKYKAGRLLNITESMRVRRLISRLYYLYAAFRLVFVERINMKNKGKGINYSTMRCPYCGSSVIYRSADGIYKNNNNGVMLYVCSKFPECDAYVSAHKGTRVPMGVMADGRLRKLRIDAHRAFDKLHESGLMDRRDAYRWLAHVTQTPMNKAHIANLGEYYCKIVIDESRRLYDNLLRTRGAV